jgi:hypothetical protein
MGMVTITAADITNIKRDVKAATTSQVPYTGRCGAFHDLARERLPDGHAFLWDNIGFMPNGDVCIPTKFIEPRIWVSAFQFQLLNLLDELPREWRGSNIVTPEAEARYNEACAAERRY